MSFLSAILPFDTDGIKWAKLDAQIVRALQNLGVVYTLSPYLEPVSPKDSEGIKWAKVGAKMDLLADNITGGGGNPGGANRQVQFNDNGVFGTDATFTFNKAQHALTLQNLALGTGIIDNLTVNDTLSVGGIASFFDQVLLPTPTTALASLRMPHGVAPSAPADGEWWTTTAGAYVQIDGATVGPLAADASKFESGSGLLSVQLKAPKYVGQVTLTNGSANVAGVGTVFEDETTSGLAYWYECWVRDSAGNLYFIYIDTITNNTAATISDVYDGGYFQGVSTSTWPGVSGTYDFFLGYANASGDESVALSPNSYASGIESLAIGYGAQAKSGVSIAIGSYARAVDSDSLAIGRNTVVTVQNAAAIGNDHTNSIGGTITLGLSTQILARASTTLFTVLGAYQSADPSGGTAKPWKFGAYSGGLLEVDVDGTPYSVLTDDATGLWTKTLAKWSANDNQPPATNYALWGARNAFPILAFNASTDTSAVFSTIINQGAVLTAGISVIIKWVAESATSGDCVWIAAFEAVTTDIDSDSFAAGVSVTTTTDATAGKPNTTTINHSGSEIDGIVAGDMIRLKITRDADAGGDTMTGDAQILSVEIQQR